MKNAATIADRYARAIFELGVEGDQLSAVSEQLESFATAYHDFADLRAVLENPIIPAEQRLAVMRDVAQKLGLGPLSRNVIGYVASRRRLRALPDIARRLAVLSDEKAGIARAEVTSAGPLPESFYTGLAEQLGALLGKQVVLERHEDPTLIAGVVTRIGDNTIDGSLRGRLESLERQLLA